MALDPGFVGRANVGDGAENDSGKDLDCSGEDIRCSDRDVCYGKHTGLSRLCEQTAYGWGESPLPPSHQTVLQSAKGLCLLLFALSDGKTHLEVIRYIIVFASGCANEWGVAGFSLV